NTGLMATYGGQFTLTKVMGGGEELSNLVLLHPNCHRQLHSCEAGSLKKGL
ncbi:HNH endonuclease, partial [Shigella boydii]